MGVCSLQMRMIECGGHESRLELRNGKRTARGTQEPGVLLVVVVPPLGVCFLYECLSLLLDSLTYVVHLQRLASLAPVFKIAPGSRSANSSTL